MADEPKNGQPGGSNASTAKPATVDTSPTTSARTAHDAKQAAEIDRAKQMSVFGQPNVEPDPFTATETDPSAGDSDPSSKDGRQPGDAKAAEGDQAGKDGQRTSDKPNADEEVGKEFLSQYDQFALPDEGKADPDGSKTTSSEVLDSDEKIAQAIDPTGKGTPEETKKNAQSLIGRQGREIGDLRKQVQAFHELQAELGQFFVFDKATNRARPTPQGILDLTADMPVEDLNRLLVEQRGLKVVPADWKGDVDQEQQDLEAAVNALIPGGDMELAEKLAEIKADPVKEAKFNRDIARREVQRQTQKDELAARNRLALEQQQRKQQQDRVEADKFYQQAYGELKKLPHYEKIKPLMSKWMGYLLKNAPNMPREIRFKLAHGMAELARTPEAMRAYGDLRVKRAKDSLAEDIAGGGADHKTAGAWADQPAPEDAAAAALRKETSAKMDAVAKAIG